MKYEPCGLLLLFNYFILLKHFDKLLRVVEKRIVLVLFIILEITLPSYLSPVLRNVVFKCCEGFFKTPLMALSLDRLNKINK